MSLAADAELLALLIARREAQQLAPVPAPRVSLTQRLLRVVSASLGRVIKPLSAEQKKHLAQLIVARLGGVKAIKTQFGISVNAKLDAEAAPLPEGVFDYLHQELSASEHLLDQVLAAQPGATTDAEAAELHQILARLESSSTASDLLNYL